MNKKIKAEIMVLLRNKYFIWISVGVLVLIGYNVFSVASGLQQKVEGGYYMYTIQAILFLLGIVEPMTIGAFLGGFDVREDILEYKLCNQSLKDWLITKMLIIVGASAVTILTMSILACG